MCSLLIRAFDQRWTLPGGGQDPSQDLTQAHDKGDIVSVQEDGWVWGNEEAKLIKNGGVHGVINITGVSADTVRKYAWPDIDPISLKIQFRQRLYKFDLDDIAIPASWLNAIRNGPITVTKAQALNFIKNKGTGARAG